MWICKATQNLRLMSKTHFCKADIVRLPYNFGIPYPYVQGNTGIQKSQNGTERQWCSQTREKCSHCPLPNTVYIVSGCKIITVMFVTFCVQSSVHQQHFLMWPVQSLLLTTSPSIPERNMEHCTDIDCLAQPDPACPKSSWWEFSPARSRKAWPEPTRDTKKQWGKLSVLVQGPRKIGLDLAL